MFYTINLTLDQRKLLVRAINSAKITYHSNNIIFPELVKLDELVMTALTKKEDNNPFTAESLLLFANYCIINGIEAPQISHVNAWIKETSNSTSEAPTKELDNSNTEDTRIESSLASLNVSCKGPNPLNMAVDIAIQQSKETVTGIVSIITVPQRGHIVVSDDTLERISNYELIAEYRDGKETFENVGIPVQKKYDITDNCIKAMRVWLAKQNKLSPNMNTKDIDSNNQLVVAAIQQNYMEGVKGFKNDYNMGIVGIV